MNVDVVVIASVATRILGLTNAGLMRMLMSDLAYKWPDSLTLGT